MYVLIEILLATAFVVCVCLLCRYSDIAKIISLFSLLLVLMTFSYIQNDYSYISSILFAILDTIIYSFIFMLIPLILLIRRLKKFDKKESKAICELNSFFIFIGSTLITIILQLLNIDISLNVGWLTAIIYYFINYYIITDRSVKNVKETEEIEILEE